MQPKDGKGKGKDKDKGGKGGKDAPPPPPPPGGKGGKGGKGALPPPQQQEDSTQRYQEAVEGLVASGQVEYACVLALDGSTLATSRTAVDRKVHFESAQALKLIQGFSNSTSLWGNVAGVDGGVVVSGSGKFLFIGMTCDAKMIFKKGQGGMCVYLGANFCLVVHVHAGYDDHLGL